MTSKGLAILGSGAGRTLAMPSLLNSAYFATDQGAAGTLYVWDGASWNPRWAPFTYPHPLTACAE